MEQAIASNASVTPLHQPVVQLTEQFRKVENLHIYLWLLKDLCWCMDFKTMGLIMIVPTVIGALWILWIQRESRVELIHNFAVCSWICANGTWMIGEFFYADKTRPTALLFFLAGIIVLSIYYGSVIFRFLFRRRVMELPS